LIRPVLLVRPDGNDTDAAALVAAGIPALVDPYLVVSPASEKAPVRSSWSISRPPGAVTGCPDIATSARRVGRAGGVDALTQAVAGARARGLRVAAVGTSTATVVDPPQSSSGPPGLMP